MSARVGISFSPPVADRGFSLWSNGGQQNVLFLWMLLRAAGLDAVLVYVTGAPPAPTELPAELREARFAPLRDAIDTLDVLIEAGAQIAAEDVARVRARGGKAIAFKFGNGLALDAERAIHDLQNNAGIFNGAVFDEVWTTEQHAAMCSAYWETCYRAPVRVLPHVWHPCFVDAMVAQLPAELRGPRAPRSRKRIAIMEPNINLVKTSHVSMLIAELAWRARPDLIDRVYVTNSIHMRKRIAFESFVGALDVAKAKADDGLPVMSFEGRYRLPWFLAAHVDVVVSHCWIDTPNYLHLDVLHMGRPLVHNITGMPGYYYSGFDAHRGAIALINAMKSGEKASPGARAFLDARLATNPINVDAHVRALAEVMGR